METVDIQTLVSKIQGYNPDADAARIQRAYEMAARAHAAQTRSTGDPYITHSLAVADILADIYLDEDTLIAALLHDVPEDTDVPLEAIRKEFGDEVAMRVDGVTKLSQLRFGMDEAEAESLRKMFIAMAEEARIVLIKLADRLHNMRTLYALPPEKQKKIALETMEIFAPLANRLGIYTIRRELEDLSLKYLEPEKFNEIESLLAEDKDDQQAYIAQAIAILNEKLGEEGVQPTEIIGRPKHIYSIYSKMQRKRRDFQQIYDIRAIRVIVESVRDCYVVLGVVHSLWSPIHGEFDDFIAQPKENLYQSLHTAVIGPMGKPLEVQIRTEEMHHIAEYGIAAHWRYKEPGARHSSVFEGKVNWLRQMLEWRKDMDARVFVESIKTDEFQDQVYVFTPKGRIIEMPAGATPIDFAYHVHTEVGHRCRGAKVNGRIVSLDYRLRTGERVEILTAKKGAPSRDWLNPGLGLVRTSRAREKIRQWFKHQARAEAISEGRALLEKELHRLGISQRNFDELANLFNYKNADDFLEALGHADISPQTVGVKLLEAERAKHAPEEELPLPTMRPAPKAPATAVSIKGVGNLLHHLARCCSPIPGDDVVGFITRGRGITIHRRDCRNVLEVGERERLIAVDWKQTDQAVYPVQVQVRAIDRSGLVHDISGIVAAEGINMASANAIAGRKDGISIITATLEISSADQLARILDKIDRLPNVLEVRRVTSAGGDGA